jgi:NADH:ubiquinone oxidoreductase subunit F (NADH-binding)
MNREDIITKIRDANIFGKGGAAYPTADKWEGVLKAEGDKKYIIVNSSEGELGLFKDLYVWRNHIDKVFGGIDYGIKFLNCPVEVYIHINQDYYNELQSSIFYHINNYKWTGVKFNISIENPSYIGGEASALMNIIENGIAQPKPRTHRTVEKGLFEKPTMMNNVETFYDVCKVLDGTHDNKRFWGIWGDGIDKKNVVRADVNSTIKEILDENKIKPSFDYYVQVGGGASGAVYNNDQLEITTKSAGGIEIFDKNKRNFEFFLKRIGNFYEKESCGKCAGKKFATSLNELIQNGNTNIDDLLPFVLDMNKKTFCKLCKSFKTPFFTFCKNILGKNLE